ncbi:thioredoxin-like protein [Syncephalastrum racemosum]|uniref:Thioredoxin-like protein n=1 Tax=Syncephalastrum racemosum TaxID=13706 RepID=A0A1X2HSX3_SYNRA|nr:thioredoxin-like protein [Syncephalastrum racemosum]
MLSALLYLLVLLGALQWAAAAPVDIPELTASDFAATTEQGIWFVEHYSPYCPHCVQFAPEWQNLADAFEDLQETKGFFFGKVDCTVQGDLCKEHGIRGTPMLQLYVHGELIETYPNSERVHDKLVEYIKKQSEQYGTPDLQEEQEQDEELGLAAPSSHSPINPNGENVALTPDTFNDAKASGQPWFIKFYAPWCGFCKKLAPTWVQLAKDLKDQVNVAEMNCDEYRETCVAHGVSGFPTMKMFVAGTEHEYRNDRSLVSLVSFAKKTSGPTINHVSDTQLEKELRNKDSVAFVYLYTEVQDAATELLQHVALECMEGVTFYSSQDAHAIRQFNLAPTDLPAALIVKDGSHIIYPSHQFSNTPKVQDALTAWVQSEKFPLVSQVGPGNAPELLQGNRMVVLGVINEQDTGSKAKFRTMAETYNKKQKAQPAASERVLFAEIDGSTWGDYVRTAYSVPRKRIPAIVVLDPANYRYFNHDAEGNKFLLDQPELILQVLRDIRENKLIGVSTLPFHSRMAQHIQRTVEVARAHWILTSGGIFAVGYIFYRRMYKRQPKSRRASILPLDEHKD